MVKFWDAALKSMPDRPSVSVLPAAIATGPPGFRTFKPFQLRFAPSATVLAEVTVLSQSPIPFVSGTALLTQLDPRLRLSVLLALLMVAGAMTVTRNAVFVLNVPSLTVSVIVVVPL